MRLALFFKANYVSENAVAIYFLSFHVSAQAGSTISIALNSRWT